MGQNHSYKPVSTKEADDKSVYDKSVITAYEKLVLPEDLTVDLQPFKSTQTRAMGYKLKKINISGYKFIFETNSQNFDKYIIFISENAYRFSYSKTYKNLIHIQKNKGYRGSAGVDYHKIDNLVSDLLENKYIIPYMGKSYLNSEHRSTFNIDDITHKFIDLTKDYQPVLYKLLVFLKTGK